jgi:hypothetical protein
VAKIKFAATSAAVFKYLKQNFNTFFLQVKKKLPLVELNGFTHLLPLISLQTLLVRKSLSLKLNL